MEEEKNTAAAVDREEAPNPKHRKRSRKNPQSAHHACSFSPSR